MTRPAGRVEQLRVKSPNLLPIGCTTIRRSTATTSSTTRRRTEKHEATEVTTEITGLCREHSFERAVDMCRMCGCEFCDMCLLYPSGKPLCKACAIAAAGVRSGGAYRALSSRDIKRRVRDFEEVMAAKLAPQQTAPVLTDPFIGHEPIGPNGAPALDRDRTDAEADADASSGVVARAVARLSRSKPEADEDEEEESPAGDIAPRIDWSNPFG
jgi:hypothetical protein